MKTRLEFIYGSITKLKVDAIVNSTNNRLSGGGGVDGSIHYAAGSELSSACKTIGHCSTGKAVITKGYKLPAKHIIHTVGPVWGPNVDEKDSMLASCYRSCLQLALMHNIKTIAFPCISTGIHNFPPERAAKIAISEIEDFTRENIGINKVIIVTNSYSNKEIYTRLL